MAATRIALLGAEATGRVRLERDLAAHLAAIGRSADFVLADTTPLMATIRAGRLLHDEAALQLLRGADAVLVTGLDLPATDTAADALLRAALATAGVAFRVVYGSGPERLANALRALGLATDDGGGDAGWASRCEKCSDPQCEHRLFTRLLGRSGRPGAEG